MKAVELIANGQFNLNDAKVSELPHDHCRIKVSYAGVCSSDIARSFENGAYQYPLIMGHEFSGKVAVIGKDATHFKTGDRVGVFPLLPCFKCDFCKARLYAQCSHYSYLGSRQAGAYCEFVNVPAWNLILLPGDVSLQDAAFLEPVSVVFNAANKSGIFEKPGSTLIIGGGFLGLLLCKILKIHNPAISITLVDRNDFKLKVGSKFSDVQINSADLKNLADGSFKYVFESTGAPEFFAASIALCRALGCLTWIGNIQGDLSLPKKLVSSILRKELNIKGVWNSVYDPESANDDWRSVVALFQRGLNPSQLITQTITLSEVPEVLKKMYEHKQGRIAFPAIKVLVDNE